MKALATLFAVVCGIATPCGAQTGSAQEAFDRRFIENVLNGLRQHAPPAYKAGMEGIRYVYVTSSDPWIMRAGVVNGSPAIEFSSGAFELLLSLAEASAGSVFVAEGPAKHIRWMTHVAGELKEGRNKYRRFLEHSGDKEPNNESYVPVLQNAFITTATYVLAHESAHILLGHTKELGTPISRGRAQELELEADILTVDLISGVAGNQAQAFLFHATGYKELFLLSATMNMDILSFGAMRDHPPEFLRAARMATEFKKKARIAGITAPQDLAMIDQSLDAEVSYYERYQLMVEYQNYINAPRTEVISFDEWRRKFMK